MTDFDTQDDTMLSPENKPDDNPGGTSTGAKPASETSKAEAQDAISPGPLRPDDLPEKFWDGDAGQVRVDDLIKSYRHLENQFASRDGSSVDRETPAPAGSADDYQIDLAEGSPVTVDPALNAELFEAGFSNDQVQKVYDLATEYLGATAERIKTEIMLDHQVQVLENHFGGPDKWSQVQDQVKAWANRHLPKDVVDSLAYSADGVLTLHRMMAREEPSIMSGNGASRMGLSEEKLRERMKDPRYWRDHDPVIVREIQEGFERLYPDE